MKLNSVKAAIVACGAALVANVAQAAPVGPVFNTLPGGASFLFGGTDMGKTGGSTLDLTGLVLSNFDQLWWGPQNANAIQIALDGIVDSPGETLTQDSFTPTKATWTGSSQINTNSGLKNVDTRFIIEILSGSASFIDAATVGIVGPAYVAEISSNAFQVSLKAEARLQGVGAFQPADVFFTGQPTIGDKQVITSFNGGFFYTPAVVPLPAAAWMAVPLLGGLGVTQLIRRKQLAA